MAMGHASWLQTYKHKYCNAMQMAVGINIFVALVPEEHLKLP